MIALCVVLVKTFKLVQNVFGKIFKIRRSSHYSTTRRNGNPVNGNHLDQSLSSSQKNGNSLTWVLVALTVCFTYRVLYRFSAESRAGEWELWVIDNEKSWSLRADARRRITLCYQTQVRLQGTGSEPLGLGPSSSVENGNSLQWVACLPPWVAKEKIGTLLLASERSSLSRYKNFYITRDYCIDKFVQKGRKTR